MGLTWCCFTAVQIFGAFAGTSPAPGLPTGVDVNLAYGRPALQSGQYGPTASAGKATDGMVPGPMTITGESGGMVEPWLQPTCWLVVHSLCVADNA